MKKLQAVTANLGLGLGMAYGLLLIPSIHENFPTSFVMLIKQVLIIGFLACIIIAPQSLINIGYKAAPKITAIFNVLFGGPKNNKENES